MLDVWSHIDFNHKYCRTFFKRKSFPSLFTRRSTWGLTGFTHPTDPTETLCRHTAELSSPSSFGAYGPESSTQSWSGGNWPLRGWQCSLGLHLQAVGLTRGHGNARPIGRTAAHETTGARWFSCRETSRIPAADSSSQPHLDSSLSPPVAVLPAPLLGVL